MARPIADIKSSMTTKFMSNETISQYYGFTIGASFEAVFSTVSLESFLFLIVATAIHALEFMFDVLRKEVDDELSSRLIHNKQWYVNLARKFQINDPLNEMGGYDVVDESKQIVSYSAIDELQGRLFLKVAKDDAGELGPLTQQELLQFKAYMHQVKDAGVVIETISTLGDSLKLVVDVFYDPLVLDENGIYDGGRSPVRDTIYSFIKNLPFNGEFVIASLVDALQNTQGVVIPTVLSAESKYAANDWRLIDAYVKPHAGYLVIADESDLTINYRAYDVS